MALDRRVRGWLGPSLDRLARELVRVGVTPAQLTATGLVLGLLAAGLVGARVWLPALAVWLLSRLADGLDGPAARVRGRGSDLGGLLDIVADFTSYGAFVVGLGVALPGARVACLALLLTYYVNGTAFLAFSSITERRRRHVEEDGRSLQFVAGLAEGTETIVAHSLLVLAGQLRPGLVPGLAWAWAAVVLVTVGQRLVEAGRHLRDPVRGG